MRWSGKVCYTWRRLRDDRNQSDNFSPFVRYCFVCLNKIRSEEFSFRGSGSIHVSGRRASRSSSSLIGRGPSVLLSYDTAPLPTQLCNITLHRRPEISTANPNPVSALSGLTFLLASYKIARLSFCNFHPMTRGVSGHSILWFSH
jgi:hypothetical protein